MADKRIYRDLAERQEIFDRAVAEHSVMHNGSVLFVPKLGEIIRFTGISKGTLTRDRMYPDRIEETTSLEVLHNGLVLGAPAEQDPVDTLVAQASMLSREAREQLIGRIAII